MNYLQQLNKARANSKKAKREARKANHSSLSLRINKALEAFYLGRANVNVAKAKESNAKAKDSRTQLEENLKDFD